MKSVNLKRSWITRSAKRAVFDKTEQKQIDDFLESCKNLASREVELSEVPKPFWRAVLDEPNLTPGVRSSISLFLFGMSADDADLDKMYSMEVESPVEFGNAMQLASNTRYNAEYLLNGRWYPLRLTVKFLEDADKITCAVQLICNVVVGDRHLDNAHFFSKETFVDEYGNKLKTTVLKLLESKGFRRLQTDAAEINLKLVRSQHASNTPGKVVVVSNSVVASSSTSWWRSLDVRPLGTPESPSLCIVDSDL